MWTQRKYLKLVVLLALLPFSFLFCLKTGDVSIGLHDVFNALFFQNIDKKSTHIILTEFRIPEALTAILCSSALAVSGLIMQSYFRNPLAGPSVLGVTSGASFVIVLLLVVFPTVLTMSTGAQLVMVFAAILGSLLVLTLLSLIQLRIKNIETLLIVGLLLSYFLSATENLLLSNTDAQNIKTFVHWGFGSFSKTNYSDIGLILISTGALTLLSILMSKQLDALQFSNEIILNSGVNKTKSGQLLILIAGILCAIVTGYCGPIAFIGLCVPHVARMFLKTTQHAYLLLACVLLASHIGLICAALSRLSIFNQTIPLNSVTSFLGAPFIVYILLNTRKYNRA